MIPNLACFKTIITLVFRASLNQRRLVNMRQVKQPNYMRLFCVVHCTRYMQIRVIGDMVGKRNGAVGGQLFFQSSKTCMLG